MRGWFGRLFSGSLRVQLIAGVALLHIALMSVFVFDVAHRQKDDVRIRASNRVACQADMLAVLGGAALEHGQTEDLQEVATRCLDVAGIRSAMVVDARGEIRAHAFAESPGGLGRLVASQTGSESQTGPAIVSETRDHLVARAPIMRDGKIVGWSWVEGTMIINDPYLSAVTRSGLTYVVVATALATIFAWLFASAILGQLRQLHLAAHRLSHDRLDAPVPVRADNEISTVLHAFNHAMRRLGEQREEVTRTRDQMHAAMAASSTGTYRWDLRTDAFQGDANLATVFGISSPDAFRHINDFTGRIHPDDVYDMQDAFDRCRLENCELSHEFRVQGENGVTRWLLNNGKIIRDAGGMPRLLIGACTDVTALRQSERALRESERRFRSLGEVVPQFVWVTDEQGVTQYCNERLLDYMDNRFDECQTTELWMEHLHPEDKARARGRWQNSLKQGVSYECEFRLRGRAGTYRWFLARSIPLRDERGQITHWVGTATDIHDQKQSEESLKTINDTLEQRIAERTAEAEFRAEQLRRMAAEMTQIEQRERRRLAQVLHDHLQQMLVAARMQISLLRGQLGHSPAMGGADRVDDLIKESIEVSRSLTVELSPPVLYDANLAVAFEWLARQMEKKHDLRVTLEMDADAEPFDEDARVFLFQATRELLFNVVKHADIGEAKITLSRLGEDGLEVCVEDAGMGFDPASLVGGGADLQGFGLFSIQERLELIGGEMIVDGGPGQGTRVRLIAPIERATRSSRAATHSSPHAIERDAMADPLPMSREDRQGRIALLLVDDHKIMREGLAGILKREPDIDIIGQAADGAQAVELARRLGPDVIIMDITMPVMNGIDATRQIMRDLPGCRVIGLSMHEDPEMESAMRCAGAVAYLTKGGPSEVLLDAIRRDVAAPV